MISLQFDHYIQYTHFIRQTEGLPVFHGVTGKSEGAIAIGVCMRGIYL